MAGMGTPRLGTQLLCRFSLPGEIRIVGGWSELPFATRFPTTGPVLREIIPKEVVVVAT
jgi:hypothetical protein